MHKLLITVLIVINILGCGPAVSHKIVKDYTSRIPKYIAVLPVRGEKAESDARYLFRVMTHEKLSQLNYKLMPMEGVDDVLTKANIGRKEFLNKPPAEMANLLGADAVVYVTITDWDTDFFLTYASIEIEARFEMYAAGTGERVWAAEYGHKESGISLDRETLKLKITKIYEPMVQKVVDGAFSTLPGYPETVKDIKDKKTKKRYFEWLQ
ncbi:MAG: hypothetical protein A2073_04335 [Deltaproteobacteria bacterium GWC2_42_11]|nr:MAG: hypothetical protein A2073_04335 [Deltaproteobacteria bacterium GWC2_42_11]HBO84826.1 hypothetical protein [Deltaproteobacteria bacterium]